MWTLKRLTPAVLVAATATLVACGHHRAVSIQVDAPVTLADRPVHVRLAGLAARESVTVRAQAVDGHGADWPARPRSGTARRRHSPCWRACASEV